MNSLTTIVVCAVLSYLLGAVPFAFIMARFKGVDIRRVGSGNVGATNVFRSVSKSLGLLTFLLDAAKGFVPAFLLPLAAGRLQDTGPGHVLPLVCAISAVFGHNWPVYLKFKGGKGVATSAGALLGLAPLATACGFITWIIFFMSTRYVSVASIAAAVAVPAAGWFIYSADGILMPCFLVLVGVLSIFRHKSNIQRLMAGTENRFNFRKKTADNPRNGTPGENGKT